MRKRGLVAVTITAAAMVVLAGGLMASNMGFKLNYPLKAADGGASSKSGTQTIALPYNPQVGMVNVSDLFKDVALAGNVQNIQKFLQATDTYQAYQAGSADFALQAGVGYFIKVGAPNFSYIIVGSHDPSAVVVLKAAGAGSKSGTNLFAPPYHTTAATARDLFIEIGVAQNVQKYLAKTDTYQAYAAGLPNFNIDPGVAYFVKVGSTINYQPSHY
jgi:hypothetical protein